MTEQFVLLWSHRQNALHIETLDRHASLNRAAYATNTPGDYRLLLVGTRAEIDATAASTRQTMLQRDAGRTRVAGSGRERPPPRSEDLNAQSDAAIEFLVGTVDRLESDGVDAAVIAESLASVLSVMLASAPAELADRVEAAIFSVVQRRRAATWAAIDAATLG